MSSFIGLKEPKMARATIATSGDEDSLFLTGDPEQYPDAYIEFRVSVTRNVAAKKAPVAAAAKPQRSLSPQSNVSRGAE